MRAFCVAALVAMTAGGVQSVLVGTEVMAIVDGGAPVAPAAASRRAAVLASRAQDLPDDLLRRAVSYVTQFEETFAAVIWRERYEQEVRGWRRFSSSGASFSTVVARRHLDSELLFIWLPRERTWITVRDVITLDGKARPAAERRLGKLLSGQSVPVDQLRQLATENGRFNIGPIVRTFNEPTLALLFLDDQYRHRFTFVRGGEQQVAGQPAVTYDFVERARPTVIQDHDHDVPARGTLLIDSAGRVLQTALELSDPSRDLSGRMTVRYGPYSRFDVLVPVEMREAYSLGSREEVTTVATYSDFRRFETAGRIIPR